VSESPTVRRDIDVPLDAADVWPLVGAGQGWTEWLVDEADLDVEPGAEGTIVDDGERRHVHVDDVVPGERVAWTWWPAGRPADASRVELVVLPAGGRTIVRVTESRGSRGRWNMRATLLASAGALALAA
jgi:uncharacterized protein YndB with AHSA1/START domain